MNDNATTDNEQDVSKIRGSKIDDKLETSIGFGGRSRTPGKFRGRKNSGNSNLKSNVSDISIDQPQNNRALYRAWDMLREINMHTKYYGNFLINGVDTIDEFLNLDDEKMKALEIEDEDFDIIMKHALKRKAEAGDGLESTQVLNVLPLTDSLQ